MQRLIDANALFKGKVIVTTSTAGLEAIEEFVRAIIDAPTIDAVPVVRCGECERRSKSADLTDSVYCPWLKQQMRKSDFCSYGKRREVDGDGT